jgi:pimeloyl-ACP methyl ester carboxylesterase
MQVEFHGQLVSCGEVSLWTETAGSGRPILFLCGLGYAGWCWRDTALAMAERHRPVLLDNRGSGRSDKPAGPYTIAMLATDAARAIDALVGQPCDVVAHSMGGYIAQSLALLFPDRVRSLALVATSPGGVGATPVPLATLDSWARHRALPPAEFARRTMPTSLGPGWVEKNPAEFERLLAARLEFPTPAETWGAQYQACAHFLIHGIDPRRIAAPTTIIHGTADKVVPYANAPFLAGRIPGARLVTLEDTGHLPFLENPLGFRQILLQHLGWT